VYVSRLTAHKRQALAIEAFCHTRTPVRLIVAGASDVPTEETRLRELISRLGVEDRVDLQAGWLPEQRKVDLLASCLATVYCPFDEDSYGYPSLEAHQSEKAVVTTTDAGGVNELIVHGHNGFSVEPSPVALARCFDELYEDRALAERLGRAGKQRMAELGISWDAVIGKLLS
jgi:glycosyltransferase involved in cell wall biosynthesis